MHLKSRLSDTFSTYEAIPKSNRLVNNIRIKPNIAAVRMSKKHRANYLIMHNRGHYYAPCPMINTAQRMIVSFVLYPYRYVFARVCEHAPGRAYILLYIGVIIIL